MLFYTCIRVILYAYRILIFVTEYFNEIMKIDDTMRVDLTHCLHTVMSNGEGGGGLG